MGEAALKGLQTEETRDAAVLMNRQREQRPVASWGGVVGWGANGRNQYLER